MSTQEGVGMAAPTERKGYTDREMQALARLQPGALPQTAMRSRCDVTMDAIKSYILKERLQPGED